jgi:hypothetical protein
VMVIRKYSPFPITSMRNMIDGAGKFNSQFFNHDKRVSESKNTRQSLFSIIRFDPDAIWRIPIKATHWLKAEH